MVIHKVAIDEVFAKLTKTAHPTVAATADVVAVLSA